VATIAAAAEPAVVNILSLVAAHACLRDLQSIVVSRFVTGGTNKPLMRAGQSKIRLLAVIERPQRPAAGNVAVFARPSHAARMHVVGLMAAHAAVVGLMKIQAQMTLRAVGQLVHPEQRKLGELVIEADALVPARLVVARLAGLQRASMGIVFLVTLGADGRQLVGEAAEVALITRQFGVVSPQGESCTVQVIERDLPRCFGMAIAACGSPLSLVNVVRTVTAGAFLGGLLEGHVVQVTRCTAEIRMASLQHESGLCGVVELGF